MRHASRYLPKYSLVREKAVGLVSLWRKFEPLMIKYKGFQLHTQEETPPEALPPEFHHLDAAPNENAASEFRPLTEEEKRQFLNSLDEKGRRILAELAGKKRRFTSVFGTSRGSKFDWYCAGQRTYAYV